MPVEKLARNTETPCLVEEAICRDRELASSSQSARHFSLAIVLPAARPAPQGSASLANDPKLIEDLVYANRILYQQDVLDGFGHVSARSDKDPSHFLMSRSMAPGLVTSNDIMEFDRDGEPVDARGRNAYVERYIHAAIYRVRPDVKAIVHSHSPDIIPYSVTGTILRPVYHVSAFLRLGAPILTRTKVLAIRTC